MTQEKKTSHRDEAVLLLNKGKRGLLRVVFGRTAMVILLLVVQVFPWRSGHLTAFSETLL